MVPQRTRSVLSRELAALRRLRRAASLDLFSTEDAVALLAALGDEVDFAIEASPDILDAQDRQRARVAFGVRDRVAQLLTAWPEGEESAVRLDLAPEETAALIDALLGYTIWVEAPSRGVTEAAPGAVLLAFRIRGSVLILTGAEEDWDGIDMPALLTRPAQLHRTLRSRSDELRSLAMGGPVR